MTVAAWTFRTCLKSVCLPALLLLLALGKAACQGGVYVDAIVPAEHEVVGEDQYVCFRVDLPKSSLKIVGVDPLSTQDVVHHMLLFGKHHVPHSEHVLLQFAAAVLALSGSTPMHCASLFRISKLETAHKHSWACNSSAETAVPQAVQAKAQPMRLGHVT